MNLEYMKVSLFEISYEKKKLFHEIQIFWDAPVLYCFRRPIYAATLTRIAINPKIMKYT